MNNEPPYHASDPAAAEHSYIPPFFAVARCDSMDTASMIHAELTNLIESGRVAW